MPGAFIDFLFEPPYIYFIMVAAIIIGMWWVLKRYGLLPTSAEKFRGQTLNEIIEQDNLAKLIKIFGVKLKKSKLNFHIKTIKVNRVAVVPATISIRGLKKGGRFKSDTYEFQDKEKRFIVFKSGGGLFENIPGLKYLHKERQLFVIEDDDKFISKDISRNVWSINKNTFPHTFGGVWVFSAGSVSFLTELAYKKMQENDKEESVNALKRFIFYNDQHTGRISAMERRQELRDESWEKGKKHIDSD